MLVPPILLFDFDGVVITQKALEYTALLQLRNKFYKWKNTQNLRLIDLARLFEEADSKSRYKALIRAYKVYKRFIPSRWRRLIFFLIFKRSYPKYEIYENLKPNLEEILIRFKQAGIPLGIVSNTSGKRLDFFRQTLSLDRYFSAYISRDDTPYRKPHPYPIFSILIKIKRKYKFSIDLNSVYLIGDLPTDIQSAKNAHIKSIALLSGHGTKHDLEKANPTLILPDIKNILDIDLFKKFLLD